MLHLSISPGRLGLFLLLLTVGVAAQPHGNEHGSMGMHGNMGSANGPLANATAKAAESSGPISYFAHGEHFGAILTHIVLMVLAWFFILPVGMDRKA